MFVFICSGNPTLIEAYDQMFQRAAAEDTDGTQFLEPPARYHASTDRLSARAGEAASASMAFDGRRYLGSQETATPTMDEALRGMRTAVFGKLHIAAVSVSEAGLGWVHLVYNTLLGEAAKQGILPPEMYMTDNRAAAEFLLATCAKVA